MSEPQKLGGERFSAAAIFEALADANSRAILRATTTESKTVDELVEECGISRATAYRKVSRLTDAGLLLERIQIRTDGRNVSTYQLRDVMVSVTFTDSVRLEIDCSPAFRETGTTESVDGDDDGLSVTLLTDGGENPRDAVSQRDGDQFRTLFVDVTGTEEVVIEQELDDGSREIDSTSASISSYVAGLTKNDGLADTIDEPESDSPE